jgi:hypothetical protein
MYPTSSRYCLHVICLFSYVAKRKIGVGQGFAREVILRHYIKFSALGVYITEVVWCAVWRVIPACAGDSRDLPIVGSLVCHEVSRACAAKGTEVALKGLVARMGPLVFHEISRACAAVHLKGLSPEWVRWCIMRFPGCALRKVQSGWLHWKGFSPECATTEPVDSLSCPDRKRIVADAMVPLHCGAIGDVQHPETGPENTVQFFERHEHRTDRHGSPSAAMSRAGYETCGPDGT